MSETITLPLQIEDTNVVSSALLSLMKRLKQVIGSPLNISNNDKYMIQNFFRESCMKEHLSVKGAVWMLTSPEDVDTDQIEWPVASETEYASDESIEFCNSNNLLPLLRNCKKNIELIFSNIKSLRAELGYSEDDEPSDEGHVVFRLELEADQATVLGQYDAWLDWFIENVNVEHRQYFVLRFKRI